MPVKSIKRKGPIGWPSAFSTARSMSLGVATFMSERYRASWARALKILLTRKPWISFFNKIQILPSLEHSSIVIAAVSSEVWGPWTTSTNFMTRTGLKKCILHTFSGLLVTSAIRELTRVELFVANIVCVGTRLSISLKSWRFTSSISIAASITKSASETASPMLWVNISLARAWSACSCVNFPLDTLSAKYLWEEVLAFTNTSGLTS